MAEAFARAYGAGLVEASSAGIFPAAIIQPETIKVMAERGIRLEESSPRNVLEVEASEIDLIVNMSGLPVARLLRNFRGREITWRIPDPIGQSGSLYRTVRNQIEEKVSDLLAELHAGQEA
jgi:arsenate reductase